MNLKKLITLVVIALLGLAVLVGNAISPAQAGPPTPPPPPQGIEIPLGRYEEPAPTADVEGLSSVPSTLSSVMAPPVATSFDGVGMESAAGYIYSPPDTHSATGVDRIVEVTNGHLAIYDKSGGLIAGGDTGAGAVSLNDFCGSAGPPTEDKCFDPKVIYDQEDDRFVVVALQGTTTATSKLHVMVSKTGSPANLATDWDRFIHPGSATIKGASGFADYPGLGVSPDAVVVTANIFSNTRAFVGTKIRVFDKADLYDGDAVATFIDIHNGTPSGATIQPAHHLSSPPSGTFYLFQRLGPTTLQAWTLTGVPGAPMVNTTYVTTAYQGTCVGEAPQMGTGKTIDTVCIRMMNAVWRNDALWGTLTGSDAAGSRAIVQWFEYDTATAGGTLRQHGAIDGGPGEFTFMPSISVDACGNAAMTYSQSSSARFPEMRYTGRAAGDPLHTMQAPVVAKTSVSFYDDFTGPPERWGDYSSTVVDPVDQSFWVANEYARVAASGAGDNGRWGTWHANFTFGCIDDNTCERAYVNTLAASYSTLTIEGNLAFSGDHDWARITVPVVPTGTALWLYLVVPEDKDYDLEVWDDACSTKLEESVKGVGKNEVVNIYDVPSGGAYRVHIFGKDPTTDFGSEYQFAIALYSPTAITLLSFTAEGGADQVTLAWETASEIENEGFNVWRSEAADGQYAKINASLIPAQGSADSGASYEYTDADVVKGVTYYYKLEDVDIHGASAFHGPVSATSGQVRIYLPLIVK
jgi:hypothetical protein